MFNNVVREREKEEMKYLVKITKWNQIKIHEFINFFFFFSNEKILTIYEWSTILLVYYLIKGDPIITLIAKGNVSRTISLEEGREKKGRESENVKMWFRGKKVFCLGREHDCRIYSVDLRAPCFYEYTEKTMGNTKLLRRLVRSVFESSGPRQKKDGVERKC